MRKKREATYLKTKQLLSAALFLSMACSNSSVLAEETEFPLDEIVITATKTPILVKQVPTDVSVITEKDIAARNAHTLKDIIDSTPGVAINRSDGRRALSIRGFDSRYSMILVDGRRLPAEPDANYELDRISLENVERIEITRGSATALYGADALGGVVNLVTKKAQQQSTRLKTTHSFSSSASELDKNYSFQYDSGTQGKVNFIISAEHTKNNASLKENGATFFPFGSRNHFDAQMEYHPTAAETWSLGASYLEEDTHEYGIMSGLMGTTLATDLHDDNRRQSYALGYTKKQGSSETYVNLFHSIWEKNSDTLNRNSKLYTNAVYGYTTISGIEARATRQLNSSHKITVGGEFRPELFKGTGIQSGEGVFTKNLKGKDYTGSEIKTNYSAVYVQDEWTLSPQWLAISSLRWDGSDRFESNLSPKLGITYTKTPDLRYKFNLGTGFRVPSPNQLYLNLNVIRNGRLVSLLGNSTLHPEKSTYYDISVEKDWGVSSGKLTYFSSNVDDMIDEVWTPSNNIQYQNIGKANLQGLEAAFHKPLRPHLAWDLNYTYLDAVNANTEERLFNRARHKISSQWTYNPNAPWKLHLWMDAYINYHYQPSAYAITDKTYITWNINFERELSKNHSLLIGIENIFNHQDDSLNFPGTLFQVGYKVKL